MRPSSSRHRSLKSSVAFDRRSMNTETAGGLGLGDALFHRLDYLPSEVERTDTNASTILGAPSSQSAVSDHCTRAK